MKFEGKSPRILVALRLKVFMHFYFMHGVWRRLLPTGIVLLRSVLSLYITTIPDRGLSMVMLTGAQYRHFIELGKCTSGDKLYSGE